MPRITSLLMLFLETLQVQGMLLVEFQLSMRDGSPRKRVRDGGGVENLDGSFGEFPVVGKKSNLGQNRDVSIAPPLGVSGNDLLTHHDNNKLVEVGKVSLSAVSCDGGVNDGWGNKGEGNEGRQGRIMMVGVVRVGVKMGAEWEGLLRLGWGRSGMGLRLRVVAGVD